MYKNPIENYKCLILFVAPDSILEQIRVFELPFLAIECNRPYKRRETALQSLSYGICTVESSISQSPD